MVETATERMLERRFEVGTDVTLEVENVSGDVQIRAGDDGVIMVHAEKDGSAHAIESTRIEMEQTDDRVIVRTRQNTGGFGLGLIRGGNLARVRYDIQVPRGCVLRVKGVSSSIDVAGAGASANLDTVSGRIRAVDLAGEIGLDTVGGSIRAENLSGTAMVKSTSGKIEIKASRLDSFNVNTVSGRVEVATPLTRGHEYVVRTVSGSVRIEVPTETEATVTMKSVSGDATFDLPAQVIKAGRRSWQGILNGGGATLDVHSVSGSLRVSGGPTASATEAPSAIPKSAPEAAAVSVDADAETARIQILRRLQEGEITLDQAMEELGTLE